MMGNQSDTCRLLELQRIWPADPPPLSVSLGDTEALLARVAGSKASVFETVDAMRDEAVELLCELVRTPSVNPSDAFEKPLADLVAGKMRALGMEVRQIEPVPQRVSNWALHHGTEGHRTLLMYSHLDTVPAGTIEDWTVPPFEGRIVGDRIVGRGVKDCKLGMAASLMALGAIQRAGVALRGNYMVTTPCDEETGGHLGIARLLETGWIQADYCIYAEGVPDRIIIGARGLCQIEITVRGKTTHTAHKELGTNAIAQMAPVITAIDSMTFTNWRPHPIVPGRPVASVNMIHGGFKENVVPGRCSIIVDIRFLPGMTVEGILRDVERVLDGLRAAHPYLGGLDVTVHPLTVGRPVYVSPEEPLVGLLAGAVREVTGTEPIAEGMVATSDSRWIVHDGRIPTINFSMGNESGHQPDEYVLIDDYIRNIKIYALTALMLLG